MIKKLLAYVVLLALCVTPSTALAETVTTTPGAVSSSAELTTDATLLNVTVPTSVLIYVDAQGNVVTPDNVPITNNSAAPIKVTSLAVTAENGWKLDSYSTNYSYYKLGKQDYSLQINGQDPSSGALAFDTPINGGESLNLALSAKVAPQKTAINASQIGSMIVTVDWYGVPSGPSYPSGYVLATDADFSGTADGSFVYIGTAEYVVVPDIIKGVPVTSYASMFASKSVKGVISTNPSITNMYRMFRAATSSTLELSLNTANVTNMASMFDTCLATTLSLGTMDTSKVTNMSRMFISSRFTNTLDLSSWNTSNVTDMSFMFDACSMTSYTLANFDTHNVKNMSYMFYDSKASTLDLSNFNTSSVQNMSNMFAYSSATSLTIPFNTSQVTNMAQMFYAAQVVTLDLSSFDTSNASVSSMFVNSATTTCYVKTQTDVNKLSSYGGVNPAILTITVK